MHKEYSYLKYCHHLQVRSVPTHRPRYTVPTACLEPVAPLTVILHNISICTLFFLVYLVLHAQQNFKDTSKYRSPCFET